MKRLLHLACRFYFLLRMDTVSIIDVVFLEKPIRRSCHNATTFIEVKSVQPKHIIPDLLSLSRPIILSKIIRPAKLLFENQFDTTTLLYNR